MSETKSFFCDGVDKAPQRSLFNALGMTAEEMKRPLVGIVSSYNEIVPGHMNMRNTCCIPCDRCL